MHIFEHGRATFRGVGSGVESRPEGFDVTSQKQLKARIRTRMAATGERYAAARAQLVGTGGDHDDFRSVVDTGWTLRGGSDPDAAALANILANSRVVGPEGPLSEELIFLVAGGLGAGYILWEFQHDDSRIVTLGFTHLGAVSTTGGCRRPSAGSESRRTGRGHLAPWEQRRSCGGSSRPDSRSSSGPTAT